MSFKLKKLRLDLELDLRTYIPGENGVINPIPEKTTPDALYQWMRLGAEIGQTAINGKDIENKSGGESIDIRRQQLINQIDFLYEKGESYWKAIPFSLLGKVLKYIQKEIEETEKK